MRPQGVLLLLLLLHVLLLLRVWELHLQRQHLLWCTEGSHKHRLLHFLLWVRQLRLQRGVVLLLLLLLEERLRVRRLLLL
jgi:hypothetical protein